MNKVKVFRGLILFIVLLYIVKQALVDINLISAQYFKRSFEFFQNEITLTNKYWDILPIQLFTHDIILAVLGVIFFLFIQKFDKAKRNYLSYLLFLLPCVVFGYLLAEYDQLINPYYFLKYPAPIITNKFSLFTHLIIRNSIELFSLFFLVISVY